MIISLFTLAWSYTVQYRNNKEGAVGLVGTAMYLASVALLVVSRILCFELFAYYLGPGNLGLAMGAVAAHAAVMAALHFVFSDSLAQCRRLGGAGAGAWARQVLLAAHNCLLNGLASIYVHNNLEIFIRRRSDEQEGLSYVPSDVRQRTLVRQAVFDAVIFCENALMLYVAKDTITQTSDFKDLHVTLVAIVVVSYCLGMMLKVLYTNKLKVNTPIQTLSG